MNYKPCSTSVIYSSVRNYKMYNNKVNKNVIIDILNGVMGHTIYKNKMDNIFFNKDINNGLVDGCIRISNEWNTNYDNITSFEFSPDFWYMGIYNEATEMFVIVLQYATTDYDYTESEFVAKIYDIMKEKGEYMDYLMKSHDIEKSEELYQRCKNDEILYKGEIVKKVTHLSFYKGIAISIKGKKEKIKKDIGEPTDLVDTNGNPVDISCLYPPLNIQ